MMHIKKKKTCRTAKQEATGEGAQPLREKETGSRMEVELNCQWCWILGNETKAD